MTDYIKREEALDAFTHAILGEGIFTENLANIPAADVRPNVKGEWLEDVGVIGISTETDCVQIPAHKCSVCGVILPAYWANNFCSNCGADMRGDGNG